MAATEEQLICSICLDVFTAPVSTACGHNFCKNCIDQHWNINNTKYQCPLCKRHFTKRPQLSVNTLLSEMASEFRQSVERRDSMDSEKQDAKPGEVSCDVCKVKALKSCLTCSASYCVTHLDPHLSSDKLKKHQLIEPVENLESRMCTKHNKPLELFCKTHQTCVCSYCVASDHAGHNVVSLKDEYEAKLGQAEAVIQQSIQEKQLKIRQIKRLKMNSEEDSEREIAHGVHVISNLIQNAQRSLNEVIEMIEDKRKTNEELADGRIKELEQEISALAKRCTDLQKLSHSQDYLIFLRSLASLNTDILSKTGTEVSICPPSYEGIVEEAVTHLEETFSTEKKWLQHEAKLKRLQHYAEDVILEPDTANPWLNVSDDGKQVSCGDKRKDLPDNPERFSLYVSVLAQQRFASGRFYYEVEVRGKTDWTLGVVNLSVNRKGTFPLNPENGYWTLGLRNRNEYLCYTSPAALLSLSSNPQRVGVFVSYEEGLVSFYDVDAAVHLYSFTGCSFTHKLCPFFNPGLHHGGFNSAPLVISPVHRTD